MGVGETQRWGQTKVRVHEWVQRVKAREHEEKSVRPSPQGTVQNALRVKEGRKMEKTRIYHRYGRTYKITQASATKEG